MAGALDPIPRDPFSSLARIIGEGGEGDRETRMDVARWIADHAEELGYFPDTVVDDVLAVVDDFHGAVIDEINQANDRILKAFGEGGKS